MEREGSKGVTGARRPQDTAEPKHRPLLCTKPRRISLFRLIPPTLPLLPEQTQIMLAHRVSARPARAACVQVSAVAKPVGEFFFLQVAPFQPPASTSLLRPHSEQSADRDDAGASQIVRSGAVQRLSVDGDSARA